MLALEGVLSFVRHFFARTLKARISHAPVLSREPPRAEPLSRLTHHHYLSLHSKTMVKAKNGYVSEEEEVEDASQNGEEEEEEEEEYEIEAILNAKQGAFEGVSRDPVAPATS